MLITSVYKNRFKIKNFKPLFLKSLLKIGINPQIHYKPIHKLTLYKNRYKNKIYLSPKNITDKPIIPIYYNMTLKQVKFVATNILKL